MVTGRPAIARKRPAKSSRWKGSIFANAASRVGRVLGHDHFAHLGDVIEEHVLGAAQADALGAEGDRLGGLVGQVGVGANPQLAMLLGPVHHLLITAIGVRFLRRRAPS